MNQMDAPPTTDALPRPSLLDLFLAFTKLGITSIGGGVNGMMHTEFVVNRRWFTDRQFLSGLALSQSLPGVNVANLALWLGFQCRGVVGAVVALAAVVLPPAVAIVLIGNIVLRLSTDPVIGAMLVGLAVAASGLSLSVGYLAMRYACIDVVSIALFACTLIGATVFHFSALAVVAVLAPIGIGVGFVRNRHERR
jgi:chromate transporter